MFQPTVRASRGPRLNTALDDMKRFLLTILATGLLGACAAPQPKQDRAAYDRYLSSVGQLFANAMGSCRELLREGESHLVTFSADIPASGGKATFRAAPQAPVSQCAAEQLSQASFPPPPAGADPYPFSVRMQIH